MGPKAFPGKPCASNRWLQIAPRQPLHAPRAIEALSKQKMLTEELSMNLSRAVWRIFDKPCERTGRRIAVSQACRAQGLTFVGHPARGSRENSPDRTTSKAQSIHPCSLKALCVPEVNNARCTRHPKAARQSCRTRGPYFRGGDDTVGNPHRIHVF